MLTTEQRSNLQFVHINHPTNNELMARIVGVQDFFPLKRRGLVSYDCKTDTWKVTSAGLVRLQAIQ